MTDQEAVPTLSTADDLVEQARALGPADVVVGIPSYNNAPTIGTTVETIRLGLQKYFPDARPLLVNSDAGSTDETPSIVAAADWSGARLLVRHQASPAERVSVPYHGIPARAAAQRAILEAARLAEARTCVFFEPDCRSVTTEWVERLLGPILEDGYDYVTPLYQRHRYHGTLTNGLIYPLVRSLYGVRVRQPLGGQAGLSGRLAAHLWEQEAWGTGTVRHGADLWMTVTAILDGFAVAATWLGPYTVDSPTHRVDLATTLVQTTEPLFTLLDGTADAWTEIRGSTAPPVLGTSLAPGVDPLDLNVDGMIRAFRLGLKDLLPLWEQVLAPETLAEVLSLDPSPDEPLRFRHDLWSRVVYDFALAYHFRVLYRDHLLRSLVPLYLGRTATFIRETIDVDGPATERWIEQSCRAFEAQKAYLVERWQ